MPGRPAAWPPTSSRTCPAFAEIEAGTLLCGLGGVLSTWVGLPGGNFAKKSPRKFFSTPFVAVFKS